MTKRPWVFHPILIALSPIFLLYSRNLDSVPIRAILGPASVVLAATAAGWSALRLLRVDGPRAALVVSAALVACFSYGPGVRLLGRLGPGIGRPGRQAIAIAVEAAAMLTVVAAVRSRPEAARTLNGACNAGSLAMIGLSMTGLISRAWVEPSARPPSVVLQPTPATSPRTVRKPDVYFLVLDAYGRSDVLNDLFRFDNRAFLDRLERKGFSVARRSTANYGQTALSIASTLNLRYHDDLAGSRSPSRLPLQALIADSAVFRAFREQGYQFVSFATGFDATELPGSDRYLGPAGHLAAFPSLVLDQTPFGLLSGSRDGREPHRLHRERILYTFRNLPDSGRDLDAPTFCFAHVVAPHPPFVFGADGCDLSDREAAYSLNDGNGWCLMDGHGGSDDYAARYREQVTYITGRVEEVIDRILASSPEPPILIVQSDHGPGSRFVTGSDRPNDLRERFGILNACYFPGGDRAALPGSITPVNTFRIVLDRYFGSNLGLLEDRNYYSPYPTPYVFTDVTAELRD